MLWLVYRNLVDILAFYADTDYESTIDSVDEELLKNFIDFLEPFKSDTSPMFCFIPFDLMEKLEAYHTSEDDENGNNTYMCWLIVR